MLETGFDEALEAPFELPLLNKWSMLMDLRSFRPPPIELAPTPPMLLVLPMELLFPRPCPIPELPIPPPDIEACGAYELAPRLEEPEDMSPAPIPEDRYDMDACWALCCCC